MSRLPPILDDGRRAKIAFVATLALGQAVATGVAAFSTRDVFAAFRDDSAVLPVEALLLIAAAGCAIAVLRMMEQVAAEGLGQAYARALRLTLFDHLTRMSARDVSRRRIGALSMRFVGDLAAVRNWVARGIARLISAGIVLPASAVILYLLNPTLAAAAAVPIGIGLAAMALAGLPLGRMHRQLRSRRARLAADMSERIPMAPELRLMGRTQLERDHLKRRSDRMIKSAVARTRVAETLRAIPDAASGLAAAAVLAVALTQGIAAAEAAAALAAIGLIIQPMRDLAGVWDRRRAWVAARDKCEDLLARPRVRSTTPVTSPVGLDQPQPLRFAKVSAGVLKSFTAEVAAGEKVAIIGGNGAGKTTLLHLAAGLETAEKGKVLLGDCRTSGLSVRDKRKAIALVSARAPILSGSLRRALTMGLARRPDDATILAKAEAMGLGGVIKRVGGLDGSLAEAGRDLSLGEARRVVLTRATLSSAPLLLLDEPDHGLDAGGQALVEQLISDSNATVLMVTHNLALARRMDRIWYMEKGRLVESGEPDTLWDTDSLIERFFRNGHTNGAAAVAH